MFYFYLINICSALRYLIIHSFIYLIFFCGSGPLCRSPTGERASCINIIIINSQRNELLMNCIHRIPAENIFTGLMAIKVLFMSPVRSPGRILCWEQVRFTTTEQDLSLASRFTLSSLEPIKCTPFSPESAPKFGILFLIRLKYLNVRPFVKR